VIQTISMLETRSRVQAIVDRFVSELTDVAREEAARIVLAGFQGSRKGVAHRTTSSNGVGHGAKRTADSLQALQDKLLAFVKSHPGLRIEQINGELGTSTKDVSLPIRKLVAGKQLRTEGQRRSTKYFVDRTSPAKKIAKGKRRKSSKRWSSRARG
jgi:hypothetical protein